MNIVFGTDGWRARIADEYTFDAVRVCAQAVAEWVVKNGGADRGVVIGFDRRFASEHFAAAAAEVVAAHDVNVHLATAAAPTQSFSWATMRRKAKAGIVITASHNPWTDNGFKVKAETGAAGGPAMLKDLEAIIHPLQAHPENVRRIPFADAKQKGRIEEFDPAPDYLAHVAELFDLDAFRGAGYTVVCETLFGSASGYFPKLIGGGKTKVVELHAERNPYFGGVNPEPIPPNIDEFLRRIPAERANVGLAVDGDADRAGLADEQGHFVTTLTLYALLMWYLCEVRGLRQPVVKTVNMTSMVDRLGERYGVKVYEVPVGFKYIGPKMQETGAMMGGEESGGFG
ncbi:MAG TPA: phosphoglucomutase/phosphomannomutase family protein, partial [Candidatus Limnocylindria bacterium]|nr:phosphoglucomutase/phosphomannomutase family protein [Candidatus Limnocylindria bacterium]